MLQPEQILQERYQLQEKLGRTAAGRQTWIALDLQLNEQVIVKLLAFSPQMQWEELKLFEREAQVLKNLNHPRIPRYRDYFSLDREIGEGLPWFGLVQDYIPGASLQELLEQGKRFTETQVKKIATQVLNILIYLHELNPSVLHRDIKPSNLILGEDEQVYLVDFGAVQDKAAFTGVTFTVVGTSGYAPLEQFWGRAVPASDLYALGATLIHLLTGIAPADLPQKDSRIQFADRITVSPNFVSWIEKITETAIEKRFTNASQALEVLESGLILPAASNDFLNIRKISRPYGTRIKLNKSRNNLEIYIPAGGVRATGTLSCFGLAFLVFVLPFSLLISLVSPVFGLGIMAIVEIIFSPFILPLIFAQTYVYFDRENFSIKRQIFGLTYGRQKKAISEILGVFLGSNGIICEVTIHVEPHIYYELGGAFTRKECAWLAQEIQDWLNFR